MRKNKTFTLIMRQVGLLIIFLIDWRIAIGVWLATETWLSKKPKEEEG